MNTFAATKGIVIVLAPRRPITVKYCGHSICSHRPRPFVESLPLAGPYRPQTTSSRPCGATGTNRPIQIALVAQLR